MAGRVLATRAEVARIVVQSFVWWQLQQSRRDQAIPVMHTALRRWKTRAAGLTRDKTCGNTAWHRELRSTRASERWD